MYIFYYFTFVLFVLKAIHIIIIIINNNTLAPKIINTIIEKVEEFFFLGLTLDTHVNWKKHSEKVSNKIMF